MKFHFLECRKELEYSLTEKEAKYIKQKAKYFSLESSSLYKSYFTTEQATTTPTAKLLEKALANLNHSHDLQEKTKGDYIRSPQNFQPF